MMWIVTVFEKYRLPGTRLSAIGLDRLIGHQALVQ